MRVHFAGLNNFDLETSKGMRNRVLARALRKNVVVSGIEMAGIVETNGKRFAVGDRVVGYTHIFKGPFSHSQYVALPEANLAILPDTVTLEGATSIVGGALTSISALERIAGLEGEDKVLVTGATGSVGVTALQLASHLGADVSGVCHSAQTDFAKSQGASHTYAYGKDELPSADNKFDVVFDTAPSLSFGVAKNYLTSTGQYITTMPQLDVKGLLLSLLSRKKWGYLMEYDPDVTRMERLRSTMSEGAFNSVVDSIYDLDRAPEAFEHQLKPAKRGKILINFADGG